MDSTSVKMADGKIGYWTSPHIDTRPLEGSTYRREEWDEISEEEFWA